MPTLLNHLLTLLTGGDNVDLDWLKLPKNSTPRPLTERELIRRESEIGAQLFGPLPRGHRREFFCLDENTWIWHEEWLDTDRHTQSSTTRYELHQNGVLKVQEGARYSYLDGQELANLLQAIQLYYERVAREVYKVDPYSGEPILSAA